MQRVLVIGATGHIGTYLVPRLVEAGYEVVTLSRGNATPYLSHRAWERVEQVVIDRKALEQERRFGEAVRALRPDIVIDLICFTLDSAQQLVEALAGHVNHLVHIGTIWTHGHSTVVPTLETTPKRPFGEYGIQKAAIEAYLLEQARRHQLPVTLLHPGHIVGPGWVPLNPAGHFNPSVFATLARGEELCLPHLGLETVHHVHADDVAAQVMAALANWSRAVGESFHSVSKGALTLRGYAEAISRWFGQEPHLTFLPFEQWAQQQEPKDAKATWEHITHSPNCSMEKARRLLEFQPRYTSLQAVQEAVEWLVANGQIVGITNVGPLASGPALA